jgi:hypothetical protein
MSDVLTVGEMESQFHSEWVLVGDPETDDSLHSKAGESSVTAKIARKSIERLLSLSQSVSRCSTPERFPRTLLLSYEFHL